MQTTQHSVLLQGKPVDVLIDGRIQLIQHRFFTHNTHTARRVRLANSAAASAQARNGIVRSLESHTSRGRAVVAGAAASLTLRAPGAACPETVVAEVRGGATTTGGEARRAAGSE